MDSVGYTYDFNSIIKYNVDFHCQQIVKKIVCVEFIIVLFNKQCFPTHRSIPVAQYLVYISHKYYSILLLSSNIMLSNVFHDSGLPSRKSFNANILAVLT